MSKNKELTITFHNPNNEKDSKLIAEDFVSRASQSVVKKYMLNQGNLVRGKQDVFENKDVVYGNSEQD